jgi:hypothetical protein
MNKIHLLFLVFLLHAVSSCSDGTPTAEGSKESPALHSEQDFRKQTQKDGLSNLLGIKRQIEKGNYRQIEDLVTQVNIYITGDSVQMTAEERLSFPQPSKEILADFFKAINVDSLQATKRFEKKYSFGTAPNRYKPDSNECPDGLTLYVDESTNAFTLSINNSFLVDAAIGCAESMTIYYLTAEREKLLLKKIDYAG